MVNFRSVSDESAAQFFWRIDATRSAAPAIALKDRESRYPLYAVIVALELASRVTVAPVDTATTRERAKLLFSLACDRDEINRTSDALPGFRGRKANERTMIVLVICLPDERLAGIAMLAMAVLFFRKD